MTDPAMVAAVRAMKQRADNRIAQGAIAAREALKPIRALHRPWTLWDECGHAVEGDPYEIGNAHPDGRHHYVSEVGWSCEREGVICAECCVDDIYQSEDCANYHDHGPGRAICPTARLIYSTDELEKQ